MIFCCWMSLAFLGFMTRAPRLGPSADGFLEFVGLCAFFTAPCAIAVVLAQAPEQERKGETLYSKCRAKNS